MSYDELEHMVAELISRANEVEAESRRRNPSGVQQIANRISDRPRQLDPTEADLLEQIEMDLRLCKMQGLGVAPNPYWRLAIHYRKSNEIDAEIRVLEFFGEQRKAPGVMPGKIYQRLLKARELRDKRVARGVP